MSSKANAIIIIIIKWQFNSHYLTKQVSTLFLEGTQKQRWGSSQ